MKIVIVTLFIFLALFSFGETTSSNREDVTTIKKEIEPLIFQLGKYEKAEDIVRQALVKTQPEKDSAELYWYLSRIYYGIGWKKELTKQLKASEILKIYNSGVEFAEKAIQLNPNCYQAYYYKLLNQGKKFEIEGIFSMMGNMGSIESELEKLIELNPSYPYPFTLLAEINQSFGNIPFNGGRFDRAVSLARRGFELMQEKQFEVHKGSVEYYAVISHLATSLKTRNWSSKQRNANQQKKLKEYEKYNSSDDIKKYYFYEGTMKLKNISDMDEAREIIRNLKKELDLIPDSKITPEIEKAIQRANKKYKDWGC